MIGVSYISKCSLLSIVILSLVLSQICLCSSIIIDRLVIAQSTFSVIMMFRVSYILKSP